MMVKGHAMLQRLKLLISLGSSMSYVQSDEIPPAFSSHIDETQYVKKKCYTALYAYR